MEYMVKWYRKGTPRYFSHFIQIYPNDKRIIIYEYLIKNAPRFNTEKAYYITREITENFDTDPIIVSINKETGVIGEEFELTRCAKEPLVPCSRFELMDLED